MQATRLMSCLPTRIYQLVITRGLQSSSSLHAKVAVVLSGCGVYDGSEVHESSAILVHLSRAGAEVTMFAPDIPQMHAINHLKGEPSTTNRNVLEESARIARGKVQPLSGLDAKVFDAVLFPGGFGAAKNLSTFAADGPSMKVNTDVEAVMRAFHSAKKPIGLCCIAPVLAAKVIKGCEVTVGSDKEEGGRWPYAGTAGAVEALGAKHVKKDVKEVHIDTHNKIVTTPAFMCEAPLHEIFDGIGAMVGKVLGMTK